MKKLQNGVAESMQKMLQDPSYMGIFSKPTVKTASAKTEKTPQDILNDLIALAEMLDSKDLVKSAEAVLGTAKALVKEIEAKSKESGK